MFVIKAETDMGTDDHCVEDLFLVKSIQEAEKIVAEFNSAAWRYQEYYDAVNQFKKEYEKNHPYPILGKVVFPTGSGACQDDKYMTVDDEYLARVKHYQKLMKENEQVQQEKMQVWLDTYSKEVKAKFDFSWNFPYADQLTIKRDLHEWSFSYQELTVI